MQTNKRYEIFSIIDNMKTEFNLASVFKQSFELSSIPAALLTYNGKFSVVNDALSLTFGYSKEEILEKTWIDVTKKEYLDIDFNLVKTCLRGHINNYSLYKEYIKKDNTTLPATLYVTILREYSLFYSQIIPISQEV